MLVSHESPISMLEDSKQYNDYDYALVHLFETHPEYYNFFKMSLAQGREVLLDNSIFELGHAFDSVKFVKYIEELNPTFHIIPDVLEDAKETVLSYKKFNKEYKYVGNYQIGVVQGKTWQEIVDCYKFMADNADYIAISFDYSYYDAIAYSNREDRLGQLDRWCKGRQSLIQRLVDEGIWEKHKPHHLLGCSLAKEFRYYKQNNIPSIRSCDTSNPVVAALHGHRYISNYGLDFKPSTLLADLIDHKVTEDEKQDIFYNADQFKNIILNK